MGLLGEMITRTYYESQNKPIYIVREVVRADVGADVALATAATDG
jgi:hypothetical protein